MIRLGVNIDHVATVRQARGNTPYPDPVKAAALAEAAGASNITFHLREDRRHIQDRDAKLLKELIHIPLNMEFAPTEEMCQIALGLLPSAVTLVPERRQERTTEGGLDLSLNQKTLHDLICKLKDKNIKTVLFIEPDLKSVELAAKLKADAIEFHTGKFCVAMDQPHRTKAQTTALIESLQKPATGAHQLGLAVHMGHGLNYQNASWLQHISETEEANIGHSIISHAVMVGLPQAVKEMIELLNNKNFKPIL